MRNHPQHSSHPEDSLAFTLDDCACCVPVYTGDGARFPESPCKNTLNVHGPTGTILESTLYSLHIYSPCTALSSVT